MDSDLKVLPLHRHPQFMEECCELINSEWPRSITARMRRLEASCDTLPTSLILLKNKHVVGHGKLSPIPSIPDSCFVESVVISRALRGLGLGSLLMLKLEEYCKNILNFSVIYLSTRGQEKFYSKLGYDICAPISIYGTPPVYHMPLMPRLVSQTNNLIVNCPPPPPLPAPVQPPLSSQKTYMKKYI